MSSIDDILPRLMHLAAARFGRDAAQLRAADDIFQSLGIDSYQALELLSELEQTFDIEVADYELQGVHTFEALAEVIRRRL